MADIRCIDLLIFLNAIIISAVFLGAQPVKAAKEVPTFHIELPRQQSGEETQTEAYPPANIPAVTIKPVSPNNSIGDHNSPLNTPPTPAPPLSPSDENRVDSAAQPAEPVDRIHHTFAGLPIAVKKTRNRLMALAKAADMEGLRALFGEFDDTPMVFFDDKGDPIDQLIAHSADGQGLEILAILFEVLEAGYIHRDAGQENEIYIWPYFVGLPPEDLNKQQLVDLFKIITAGDYEDMLSFGAYAFYRAGIAPNGDLKFFVAGD